VNTRFVRRVTTNADGEAIGILLFAVSSLAHNISSSALFDLSATPNGQEGIYAQIQLKGVEVVHQLRQQLDLGGLVDEYLADQIVIFMALATTGLEACHIRGGAQFRTPRRCEVLVGKLSSHTLTAMKVAEDLLGNISFSTKTCEKGGNVILICEEIDPAPSHVSCEGR
jgi:RNA 3'-terminal phosphate cyclase